MCVCKHATLAGGSASACVLCASAAVAVCVGICHPAVTLPTKRLREKNGHHSVFKTQSWPKCRYGASPFSLATYNIHAWFVTLCHRYNLIPHVSGLQGRSRASGQSKCMEYFRTNSPSTTRIENQRNQSMEGFGAQVHVYEQQGTISLAPMLVLH